MRLHSAAALLLVSAALSPAAHADTVVYDARADFKLSSSNGAWSYGYAPNKQLLTSSFIAFPYSSWINQNQGGGVSYQHFDNEPSYSWYNSSDIVHDVGVYSADATDIYTQRPGNDVVVRSEWGADGQVYVTRLTVGTSGIYDLAGVFERLYNTTSTIYHIQSSAGTTVAVTLNDTSWLLAPTLVTYTGDGRTQSFGDSGLQLHAGDTVKFLVVGDEPIHDVYKSEDTAVGFRATLAMENGTSTVPEPNAALLLGLGLAGSLAVARRRRAR